MLRIKAKASRKFIMQPKTCPSMQFIIIFLCFSQQIDEKKNKFFQKDCTQQHKQ